MLLQLQEKCESLEAKNKVLEEKNDEMQKTISQKKRKKRYQASNATKVSRGLTVQIYPFSSAFTDLLFKI